MNTEASDFPIDNARMLRAANKEIADLKDTIEKKEVAFKLITKAQYDELQQLREALKEMIPIIESFNYHGFNGYDSIIDRARKLIELNQPEK